MSSGKGRPEPRFDWFIPIDGDGNRAGTRSAQRPPDFDYLRQVVETAEECGFYSLLIPTRFANGLFAEDAPLAETWTTATALAAVTQRIRFLVAVRPGFISLGLFAQMAAALHQISRGRLDVNIVPGGIQNDLERLGDVSDDKRNSVLHEYAIMVKWFLLHGLFIAVEETLRAIQRAAPDEFPVSGRFKSVAKVTSAILTACGFQDLEELFRLTRLTRNTIHTNGVFLPEDETDQGVEYGGGKFSFKFGKILEWLNDQRAVWFVEELVKAMNQIVRSSKVAQVDYCPRTQV